MHYQIKNNLINIAILIMGACSLLFNYGHSYAPFFIFLLSWTAFTEKFKSTIDNDDKKLIGAFYLYFLVVLLDTLIHEEPLSNLDLAVRFAIGGWFIYYLSRYQLSHAMLWTGLVIGAISAGIYAIYAQQFLGMVRVKPEGLSSLNEIHFGNLSMMMAMCCFAGIFWANTLKYRRIAISILFVAGLLAVIASLLSGTRSGWLGSPFVLLALYSFFADHFSKKVAVSTATLILAIIIAIVAIPQTHVQGRVLQAKDDIMHYLDGNSSTSSGLRFEMWRSGYAAFKEKPILGWGEQNFYQRQKELVDELQFNPLILTFNHLHNQYVEELAKRGIIGLASLLLLFVVTMRLFFKRLRSPNDKVRALAAAGVISVICMIDFCFTQAMLRITSGVMVFIYFIVFFWAVMRSEERSLNNTHAI